MAIAMTYEVRDGVLHVKATGEDDTSDSAIAYGQAVIAAAVAANVPRVLCDERDLTYRLDTVSTYESAKLMAELAPAVAKVALVCPPGGVEDAEFWATVANNRGLQVRVTTDYDAALAWLTGDQT